MARVDPRSDGEWSYIPSLSLTTAVGCCSALLVTELIDLSQRHQLELLCGTLLLSWVLGVLIVQFHNRLTQKAYLESEENRVTFWLTSPPRAGRETKPIQRRAANGKLLTLVVNSQPRASFETHDRDRRQAGS